MSAIAELHPNEVARKLMGRDYISYSSISSFRRCPLAWKFRYVDGLPEKTVSANLIFGGAIHSSIEHHFNELMAGNPPPDQETLLSAFWESWSDRNDGASIRFNKGDDIKTIGHLADRILATFKKSTFARPQGAIIGVEEELRGKLVAGVPDLLARIDLLVETENELIVSDFKTARNRWNTGQAESNGEQLLLYNELARRLIPGKKVRLEFAVVDKTKVPVLERHSVTVNPQRVTRTKRAVEMVWRAIKSGNFYPVPSPMNCPSCPFRKPCRAWSG